MHKPKWKKTEDVLLSYDQEDEPVRFVKDFLFLPDLKPFELIQIVFYS